MFLLIIDCKLPLTATLLIFPLEDRRLFLAIAIEIDAFQGIFSFIFLLLALETLFFFTIVAVCIDDSVFFFIFKGGLEFICHSIAIYALVGLKCI